VTAEQLKACAHELISALTGLSAGDAEYSAVRRQALTILARHDQPAVTDQHRDRAREAARKIVDTHHRNCGGGSISAWEVLQDCATVIIARAIAESERELVEGLRAIVNVLGPGECKAVSCQGCQHEHAEAVAIARALLAKRGRK
jgi:hypothetical protein